MACKVPRHDWRARITPSRVAAAVVASVLATVAIALDTDQIAGLLITVAAVLFATQFGIPVASAMAVGHPIGGVFAALSDREQLVTLSGKRLQHSLTEVAHYVTGDRTRATDLAMLAIEDAARQWRGRLTQELDNYLLCHAAHLAILDHLTDTPAEDEVQAGLAAQPLPDPPAEAQRAFALAARLGSINAAAAELGIAWPSLRKAFTRHQPRHARPESGGGPRARHRRGPPARRAGGHSSP